MYISQVTYIANWLLLLYNILYRIKFNNCGSNNRMHTDNYIIRYLCSKILYVIRTSLSQIKKVYWILLCSFSWSTKTIPSLYHWKNVVTNEMINKIHDIYAVLRTIAENITTQKFSNEKNCQQNGDCVFV